MSAEPTIQLELSSTNLNYGTYLINDVASVALTIKNVSNPSVPMDVMIFNPKGGKFKIARDTEFTLDSNTDSKTIYIEFRSDVVGTFTDSVTVNAKQNLKLQTVSLTATTIETVLSISTNKLDFGEVDLGKQLKVIVANNNNNQLPISVYATISGSSVFTLNSGIGQFALKDGESSEIIVDFIPTDAIKQTSYITIDHDASTPQPPIIVELVGSGIKQTIPTAPTSGVKTFASDIDNIFNYNFNANQIIKDDKFKSVKFHYNGKTITKQVYSEQNKLDINNIIINANIRFDKVVSDYLIYPQINYLTKDKNKDTISRDYTDKPNAAFYWQGQTGVFGESTGRYEIFKDIISSYTSSMNAQYEQVVSMNSPGITMVLTDNYDVPVNIFEEVTIDASGSTYAYTNKKIINNNIQNFSVNIQSILLDDIYPAIRAQLTDALHIKITFVVSATADISYNIYEPRQSNGQFSLALKTQRVLKDIQLYEQSEPIDISVRELYYSSTFGEEESKFTYIDVKSLVEKNSPVIQTDTDYKDMMDSSMRIIENNNIIIDKINGIMASYINNNKSVINYDLKNLYSSGNFYISGSTDVYVGNYSYDYKKQKFFTVGIDVTSELIYKNNGAIDNITLPENFDFTSILAEQKTAINSSAELFRNSSNNIALNLNKKLSFTVGLENTLVDFYSKYEQLIYDNLKYYRNYNEVKKFSVSRYVKTLMFSKTYLNLLKSINAFYSSNNNSALLIEDALEIKPDSSVVYKDFAKIVGSRYELSATSDKNFILVNAFYLMNKKLVAFIEDFQKINSALDVDVYNKYLILSCDLLVASDFQTVGDGLQFLQSRLSMYLVDNIWNTSQTTQKNETAAEGYIKSDTAKKDLVSIINNLNSLIIISRDLQFLFGINESFNIFLDFDVKSSEQFRQDFGIDSILTKYQLNEGTNSNISLELAALQVSATAKPIVLSRGLGQLARRDPTGTGDFQQWNVYGSFFIPRTKIKSFKITSIVSGGPGGAKNPSPPTPWNNESSDVWEWQSGKVENNWSKGQWISTTIYYEWFDADGKKYEDSIPSFDVKVS